MDGDMRNSSGVVAGDIGIENSGGVAGGSGGGVVVGSGNGSSGGVSSGYGGGVVGGSGIGKSGGGVASGGTGIGNPGVVVGGAGGAAARSERRRLVMEPKPFGETTVFNWKKLMQMANSEPLSDDSDDDVDEYMRVERPKPNYEPVSDDDSDIDVDQYMCVERPRPNHEPHDSDDDQMTMWISIPARQNPNKRPRDESGSQEVQKWRRTSVCMTDASGLAEKKLGWSILQLKHLVETTKAYRCPGII